MNSNPYLQGQQNEQMNQNLYPSFESNSNVQDIPLGFQIQQQQQYDYNQVQYNYPNNNEDTTIQYELPSNDLPELPTVKRALPPPITDDIIQDQMTSNVMDELNSKLNQTTINNQTENYDEFFENQ